MNALIGQVRDLILHPAENPLGAALGIGIIAIAFLLIVVVLLVWAVPGRPKPDRTATKKVKGKRSPRSWMIVISFALLAVAAGYVTTSQNSYCTNTCHAMSDSADDWQSSSHKDVACIRCHEGRLVLSAPVATASRVRSIYLQIKKSSGTGAASVPDGRCVECHSSILEGRVVSSRGIAMRHSDVLSAGASCSDCHGVQGHQKSPKVSMSQCSKCHNGVRASAACRTCHLKSEQRLIQSKNVSFGNVALPSGSACGACHDIRRCDTCHGISMPHPADFVDKHREAGLDRPLCARCHPDGDCKRCHKDRAIGR